jgi:hypothetical protein
MHERVQILLLYTLLATSARDALGAQMQPTATTKPIRVETEILKSVVFITVEAKEPDKPARPGKRGKAETPAQIGKPVSLGGTGFLVTVPDSRLTNGSFIYLVTNRHVAAAIEQDDKGNCRPLEVQRTYVTMNLKEPINGNRADRQLLTFSKQVHWYYPNDEAIDLAVMPFTIRSTHDIRVISINDFLTTEILDKQQVVPGDKVLTGGYFYLYGGSREVQPLLREGVLAMLPDEPISTTTCKPGNVYLVDVHIIAGNSGSPLFIIPGLPMNTGISFGGAHNTFGLLGIVSGYMQETENLKLKASTTWKASIYPNSGISVVVPAQQLKDLLESSELQKVREEAVQHATKLLP